MTAAGEQVLAVAYGEVGTQSGDKYWAWYGADLGSYCACFVSWSHAMAGHTLCAVDFDQGFVLVSNGTYHSYGEGEIVPDFEPGDTILFSWYSWEMSGGLPVITDPEWAGWVAGDHTGIFAYWIDRGSGQFASVEGNTSGGVVAERTDRYAYQVCGYWRPPSISGGASPTPEPPKPTYNLTELGMFILGSHNRGGWLMGAGYAKHLDPEEYSQVVGIPGIGNFDCGDNDRAFDVLYNACMNGAMASES